MEVTVPSPMLPIGVAGDEPCYFRPFVGARVEVAEPPPATCLPDWWIPGTPFYWSGVGDQRDKCCAPTGVLYRDIHLYPHSEPQTDTGHHRLFALRCCGEEVLYRGQMERAAQNGHHFWMTLERPGSGSQIIVPSCFSFDSDAGPAGQKPECVCYDAVPGGYGEDGYQRVPWQVAFFNMPSPLYLYFNGQPRYKYTFIDPRGQGGYRARLILSKNNAFFSRYYPQHRWASCQTGPIVNYPSVTYQLTGTATHYDFATEVSIENFYDETLPPGFKPSSTLFVFTQHTDPYPVDTHYPSAAINWSPCVTLIDPPPLIDGGFSWLAYPSMRVSPTDDTGLYPPMDLPEQEPFYFGCAWDGTLPGPDCAP